MPQVRILYIIVNYRRAQLCSELAERVRSLPGSEFAHVQIVDNSDSAEEKIFLAALPIRENFSTVTPPGNLGFYGGAHFGLTTYLEGAPLPDWVIVSNPDIGFPDDNFLTGLMGRAPEPGLGALAPDIRLVPENIAWETGHPQNPLMGRRPSAERMRLLQIIFASQMLYALLVLRSRLRRQRTPQATGARRKIYAPHGSAIVFSCQYFERGASLKHGVFLYAEELFVAEELRRVGLHCTFEPALRLSHVGGASTSALGNRTIRLHNYEAIRFLRRRYFAAAPSDSPKA